MCAERSISLAVLMFLRKCPFFYLRLLVANALFDIIVYLCTSNLLMMTKEKDLKLYYSINEVAEMFDVKGTTLRFWEREFPKQINPKKTGRNVRQYTKDDIEQIRVIHNLVKVRGLKISAARELLKKNKSGVQQETELVARLQKIRAELVAIKKDLETLEQS